MGMTYSTSNYTLIINIVDDNPVFLCSININNYINLEEVNRYLVYKNKSSNEYLFYYGKVDQICDFTCINEKLLTTKSKKFSNFLELEDFIIQNIKDIKLINSLCNNSPKILADINYRDNMSSHILPDMNYLDNISLPV
jgi:hypothetical protein